MLIEYRKFITRDMLKNEPYTFFVFGDNMQRVGLGGQAREMRGEPNAYGIPTKWNPSMAESSFFKDEDLFKVLPIISKAYNDLIRVKHIVWPLDGIGTGLAQLPERAPKIWALMEELRITLEKFDG